MVDASFPPTEFIWDGNGMIPKYQRFAARTFVIGQHYLLADHQEPSSKSRRFYFACVRDAFLNLPEGIAEQFPTPDDLRKRALIMCGFCHSRHIAVASEAEARRVATFIEEAVDYCLVSVEGNVVTELTPMSQKIGKMNKQQFRESSQAVLEYVASLCGVTVEELGRNAGTVA